MIRPLMLLCLILTVAACVNRTIIRLGSSAHSHVYKIRIETTDGPVAAEALFLMTTFPSLSIFIDRLDIPDFNYIPMISALAFADQSIISSCLTFKNSTTKKLMFW
jgi:hypothetical protein